MEYEIDVIINNQVVGKIVKDGNEYIYVQSTGTLTLLQLAEIEAMIQRVTE